MNNVKTDTKKNKERLIGCIDSILSELSNGNNIELRMAADGTVKALVVRKKNLIA